MSSPHRQKNRFHDLDALRAFAMLLGIILHGALPFKLEPSSIAQDIDMNSTLFEPLSMMIHGFRMPLFFVISGFFTMMMWEKRGYLGLLKHRSIRILVPLLIGLLTLLPLIKLISQQGTEKKRRNLASHFGVGVKETGSGVDSLILAACRGDQEAIEKALNAGVDVNQRGENGATALHSAAFFGQSETVDLLLSHGANIKAGNVHGKTAVDILKTTWAAADFLSGILPMDINKADWHVGRKLIRARFKNWNGTLAPLPSYLLAQTLDQTGWNDLHRAAFGGNLETAAQLLSSGLDINSISRKGNTATHLATLFGQDEFVRFMIDSGADFRPINEKEEPIVAMLNYDWEAVQQYQPTFSMSDWETGKQKIAALFKSRDEEGSFSVWKSLKTLYYELVSTGQLAHLWFLNHLAWLTLGFLIGAPIWRSIRHNKWISRLTSFPLCLLWLLPLTCGWQFRMHSMIGASSSAGWLPYWPVFGYYAGFFAFGSMSYKSASIEPTLGKGWPLSLTTAGIFFIAALRLHNSGEHDRTTELWFSLFSAAYTWMAIFGLIGLFQRFTPGEHKATRYLSDASYWLYLSHVPLIIAIQSSISEWRYPAEFKFLVSCTLTISLLLLIYEFGVRYTFIGTVLNGRRLRPTSPLTESREIQPDPGR